MGRNVCKEKPGRKTANSKERENEKSRQYGEIFSYLSW